MKGDSLARVRRTREMTTGAELLRQMLPPLTAACERMSLSAILEPCYDVGGDGFDYAIDGVTEACNDAGQVFGRDRLIDLAERHAAAELPAAETLRRLAQAVAVHRAGPPADDVTMVLAEWSAAAARRNVP